MTSKITKNIEKIRSMPDNSIMDIETIIQIALYAIKENDNSLNCKIRKEFEFCGLYPQKMIKCNITPDNI
jgi:hypothetical protein